MQTVTWIAGLTFVALTLTTPIECQTTQAQATQWQYGFFADFGYSLDFNHPSNHLFRNRGTTPRVDEVDWNMAGAYLRKDASEQSRWGTEWAIHGGRDSQTFGFSSTAPNLAGANWLRYVGRANVSYLAPVGKGLTVQAGIFNSFIVMLQQEYKGSRSRANLRRNFISVACA